MITALEKTLEHSTAQYRQKRANQPLPHQYIYVYIYIAGKPCHKLQKLKHIQKVFVSCLIQKCHRLAAVVFLPCVTKHTSTMKLLSFDDQYAQKAELQQSSTDTD